MTPTLPSSTVFQPTVSVVIPTYNRGPFLERAIRSILTQAYPADRFEVIVIDDGSTDGTGRVLDRCRQDYTSLRVLHQPNRGPATARNLGIRQARGEIVLFMDDDCVADRSWIAELVQHYTDAEVGGVAGRIRFVPPNDNFANRGAANATGCGQPVDDEGRIAYFVTANASFRRAALEQVGGFDPSFPHAAQEDIDLSLRVLAAGWQLCFASSAVVDHYHNHTIMGDLRRSYQIGQAEITLFRKHGMRYSVWYDLPSSLLAFTRVPFGCIRNLLRGGDVVVNLSIPLFHRLNGAMLALGRTKAHLTRRPTRRVL